MAAHSGFPLASASLSRAVRRPFRRAASRVAGSTASSISTRVLARLGLRDRVQIAVYAYEHGIVRPGRGTPPPGR